MSRIRAAIRNSRVVPWLALGLAGAMALTPPLVAASSEVKDLKYGAVLYEFYQQNYFETLVEYAYAEEMGGIVGHGTYPELLKGGVSLSYGLDAQAEAIFARVAEGNVSDEDRNRAWFYLGKMQYLRGDAERAARNLAQVSGPMPDQLDAEYRYLAALVNIRLGYYEAGENVARTIDADSPFAPYFHFNLGIAYGKQQRFELATAALSDVVAAEDDSAELQRLADRARMALSYLYAEMDDLARSEQQLVQVRTHGAYSNRGLLGASWLAVNGGEFRKALAPLGALGERSIALPEVQEALLLKPHVYEQMGLDGRAARGFIEADAKYREALAWLASARESLQQADVMELFVRNLDQVLGESDWFGQAPAVSVNHLSPFLVELMSDHSFQSVLKDLRDLYAIRNNLESWQSKHDDFAVILEARGESLEGGTRRESLSDFAHRAESAMAEYDALVQRAATLPEEDQEHIQWMLEGLASDLERSETMVGGLQGAAAVDRGTGVYGNSVRAMLATVDAEYERTATLIEELEGVMLTLVSTELDIHEQRLKHYQVEAQLAKVRILDRSLLNLDGSESAPAESADATVSASFEHPQDATGETDDAI
ncbi:hypothetical protein [Marinobacter mobilis]|uniref:Tetratricopeptide repeat-containing protein n=1 Tax=Marinobacter mobilis TaxID=488533 RepID=A0A1H2QHP5_9GAMM|nr:hypothetical protein [Marinobacter mobilis]SDW06713.1 hypothetical protein SAMN04487960_101234 [Marinobacter mobilis]